MSLHTGVFDAGPLTALYQIDRLRRLKQLIVRAFVPPEVACDVEPFLGELPDWIKIERARAELTFSRSLKAGVRSFTSCFETTAAMDARRVG